MTEQIFTNARLVLAEEIISGTLVTRDGLIHSIDSSSTNLPTACDCEGDLLLPGLVELHTDALEGHLQPRPGAVWPSVAAVVAHDSQLAAAGITTVLDAISLGSLIDRSLRNEKRSDMIASLGLSRDEGILRADHLLHLRCEVTFKDLPEVFDELVSHRLVRLVSVMDHTPGQRQFVNESQYRKYYQGKFNLSDTEMERFMHQRRQDQQRYGDVHRRHVVQACRARGISLASHDDATAGHVQEALEDGVEIAEFPTTVEAARVSHEAGIRVMMGGPNIVRGGSHSGNVSARDLAAEGFLDIVSSDYVPNSLLHAAFLLSETIEGIDLPTAVRSVTKNPAESVNLTDRGEIGAGRRADLIRVHPSRHHPIVRGVWREGRRVA